MTLHFTEREAVTLVVALRVWQNELSYYTLSELRDYYPDLRDIEPLSIDEVEDVVGRLGTSPGSGNATVSTVRPSAGGDR